MYPEIEVYYNDGFEVRYVPPIDPKEEWMEIMDWVKKVTQIRKGQNGGNERH